MANLRVQRRRRTRSDDGASLVEFALLLPVFTMLLFGGITAGFALNEKQQMTHATREGARYAAAIAPNQEFDLNGDLDSDDAGEEWALVVRDLIVERSSGSLEATDICVSLVNGSDGNATYPLQVVSGGSKPASDYTTATGTTPCIPDQTYAANDNDDGLRVQVTARTDAKIDLVLFGSFTVDLASDATARSEGDL